MSTGESSLQRMPDPYGATLNSRYGKLARQSQGETFFRMIAMFRQENGCMVDADEQDAEFIVHASLRRSRGGRKVSAVLKVDDITTGTILSYPEDYDKIIAVLPDEFWPQFVKDLQVPVPVEQPVLV